MIKKLIVHIIRDFIREEYKDYIEKSTAKEADWVIYLGHEDDFIKVKNIGDYKLTRNPKNKFYFFVKLIEDHYCSDLCDCIYVNAGMYEEFNDYLSKYQKENENEYYDEKKLNRNTSRRGSSKA